MLTSRQWQIFHETKAIIFITDNSVNLTGDSDSRGPPAEEAGLPAGRAGSGPQRIMALELPALLEDH
jgi:hypothetical protein